MISPNEILETENQFSYHAPKAGQAQRYEMLRQAGKSLCYSIINLCPPCADRSAAIRKLRECIMTANASIALETDSNVDNIS